MDVGDMLKAWGGPWPQDIPLVSFRKVAIDSRQVQPGDIFFALRGEKDDGHNYVQDALRRGAQGVVIEREVEGLTGVNIWYLAKPSSAPVIEAPPFAFIVEDTLRALQKCSAYHRAQYSCRAIGVTGSVGKTTAKEAIWAVLKERYITLRSQGNFNSEIGLPLTLLEIGPRHQRVVLEMGMYALGEIKLLCELAKPEWGLVTNVGPVHLERLGSLEAIARAKAELVEALPQDGVALLNGDDPRVRAMAQLTQASTFTFGLQPENDLYADDIESRGLEGISFRLHHHGQAIPMASPLRGWESIWACLAGAAVGLVEGLGWEEIARGLGSAIEQPRLRVLPGRDGITIVDDSYNASPASMVAALEFLSELPGRRVAVLGDMRELGSYEEEGHRLVGQKAAELAAVLVAVGELGRIIGEEARGQGLGEVHFALDNPGAMEVLGRILRAGDAVLVKGSRGMHMEGIVARLEAK